MVAPATNCALLKGLVSVTVGGGTGAAAKVVRGAFLSAGLNVGLTSIRADGIIASAKSVKAMTKNRGVLFMSILRSRPAPVNANGRAVKDEPCWNGVVGTDWPMPDERQLKTRSGYLNLIDVEERYLLLPCEKF